MAAVRTLSARASQGRLHLGHRRLLVPRHHARRRHADHRDGRDERLPQGTAGQDPRRQRAPAGAAAGIAADRLEGCRRAHQPGPGHPPRGARRGRSGAGAPRRSTPPAFSCAASAPADLDQPHLDRQEHQAGHARRIRRGAGRRHRPPARRSIVAACRRQHHAGGAAWRGDPDGHHAAHQALQGGRGVRDRHVGI